MRNFTKKVYEVYKPLKFAMLGALGFIILTQGLNLTMPYINGKIVDSLVNKRPAEDIYFLAIISLLLLIFRTAMGYVRDRYELKYLDYKAPERIHSHTLQKMFGFSIGQHTSEHSGVKQTTINRGKNSLKSLGDLILYNIIPLISEIIILTSILIYWSLPLGLIVFSGIFSYAVFVIGLNLHFRKDFKKSEENFIQDGKFQQEVVQNIGLVMIQAQETKACKECLESFSEANKFSYHLWKRFCFWATLRNLIPSFTRFIFMMTGIHYVLTGQYTVGQFVMFLSWAMNTLGSLGEISVVHRQFIQAYISVKKYFEMLEIEPDVKVIPNPVKPEKFSGQIEFRNVTFFYKRREISNPETDEGTDNPSDSKNEILPALDKVSFVVKPGETVAIVGESGAGKSTIVRALIRAQDPDAGQIIIDNNDLRILDLKHFRESIGLVDQDVSLFDQTLRYNITYGLNGRASSVSDKELILIAEMSCIDRFFHRLEKGFDTIIGERGVKLSGGERQRVSIARALVKKPDILIFDEATSNLDSENESLIRESINKASKGRTTIIIAHRFSTIRNVDKIIVFDKGKVVGQGTHKELALSCDHYQRLLKNQTF